ncbi:MAG TPA: RimK/LysX family protein [Pelovirga sp.]|nr:RimK/LysX family protein [Pelovirga sp.]
MEKNIQVGWREWFSLPELGIERIKAKIDTGARTSALHALFVEPYVENGQQMVHFGVRPLQKRTKTWMDCSCPVHDYREVCDSGGHREMRYVIYTPVQLGEHIWPIEMTLTNRDTMKFRMLLGRSAMEGMIVSPNHSYLFGRPRRDQLRETEHPFPVGSKVDAFAKSINWDG